MNTLSRPRRYGILIFVALIAVGGIYYGSRQAKKTEAITLDTTEISRGNLVESISSTGTLSALEEVTVGSQVSGIITKVLVDFNSQVKQGELLAVIDPQTLQAQVDSSRAVLAQRQTAYDEAVKQLAEGQSLYAQKYLSDRDLRTLDVTVRTAKEQLQSAKVDFNKQNVQLKYAEIRSPIDGVIESRSVDPGNTVQASMTAPTLFVVASDLRKMKILANVDETQIASIKEGMQARFTVSGIDNKTFNANVRQVRLKPTTSNNVVTYTVVLDAENPEMLLFPGMTATIDFIQANIENALLVPTAALRVRVPNEQRIAADQQQAGAASVATGSSTMGATQSGRPAGSKRNAVWRVNAEGKAYRVPVRLLGSDLTSAAVEPMKPDTLKEGDRVVIRVVQPNSSNSSSSAGSNNQNRGGIPGGIGGGFGGGR
jgi:HlyD family secretion protein